MHKQVWFVLGILSFFFAGGIAAAEEEAKWYIVVLEGEATLCGQTSEGQFLCLRPETAHPARPSALEKVGTLPQDWSFFVPGPGPA